MVDVTKHNFEALLPEIAQKINKATFIAVDAEYTGIYAEDVKCCKSLFDSADERYEKARAIASQFTACQYGLAIFERDWDQNIYRLDAYNFYLFPVAFDAYSKRDVLTCQISCINFLARHNFDFNMFMRDGVPYLNKEKAENLKTYLKSNRHFMNTAEYLDPCYFPRRLQMLNDEDIEDIVSHLAGFAKVIDLIQASQKPVIGHNFYTDLLLTHQLFYSNLPKSYEKFKSSLMENVFPIIYDTKFLAREVHQIRKSFNHQDTLLQDTNLFALYTNTYSVFQCNMPLVESRGETLAYQEVLIEGRRKNLESIPNAGCHNAAFDAAVTGCVFLNLCFMAARPQAFKDHRRGLAPTFTELLGRTEIFRDKINIARAIIPYVNLAGADPESHRPNWIIARSTDGRFIEPTRLKLELVKYGDIEVDAISETEVIIACGGIGCHRQVWGDLKKRGLSLTEKIVATENVLSWFRGLNFGFKIILGIGCSGLFAIAASLFKTRNTMY